MFHKLSLISLLMVSLTGCPSIDDHTKQEFKHADERHVEQLNQSMQADPGLQGCTSHVVRTSDFGTITVIRCPASNTSVGRQLGKFQHTVYVQG